jgi:hypothetical protein
LALEGRSSNTIFEDGTPKIWPAGMIGVSLLPVEKLESTMIGLHETGSRRPYVKALFEDGADSFVLPFGSTLEELAERIDDLGARHTGTPVAIQVHFYPTASPRQQS